eukprot:CAMPEP_0116121460 /NCGR_PEP_ID=MMETSP0329-20121206/3708_1 /TAXON_ID=697910 /ORGANISM="Pseudo-nitzschia arenysensis, Strain B593" /LENGTH=860 /DNA_ID=CAMNT_0003615273 /DNA_START=116 /DNA_END=2698 /DNA_ORIENTATION=+
MTPSASCGVAWKRFFAVACLGLSLANSFCQAFSTQSIARTRFDKLPSLHSTSEESIVSNSSTDATEPENDLETQLQDTDLLSSNEYFGRNGYSMTSGYSRFLYTREEKPSWWTKMRRNKQKNRLDMNEDGYADMQQRERNRSILQKVLRLPFKTAKRVLSRSTQEPGTLILVRHGESEWNKNKTFTGWADPDLTDQGKREVEHAARLLMEGGYHYDIHVVFTSRLKRAIRSTWILLQEFNEVYLPVFKSWRLNERFYGALTGLNKTATAEQLGEDIVQGWRGSLRSRPPALTEQNQYYPGRDRKYADLTKDELPVTESLLDCMERTKPLWDDKILFELKKGRNVLVVAHANTLRGLVKTIDDIGEEEIRDVAIPTGIPIVYKFEKLASGELQSVPDISRENSVSQLHMTGQFLEKPGLLKEALKMEEDWKNQVPGYEGTMSRHTRPMTGLERSLYKLNAVRELGEWANEFIDMDAEEEDDGNDGNGVFITQEKAQSTEATTSEATTSTPNAETKGDKALLKDDEQDEGVPTFFAQPCVTPVPNSAVGKTRQDSVIVIIRHGKTQHNKLGLFTGWEDAPLADEGIEEAKIAGQNLKKHGFEFDVVYTSWLSRALETAWYVMDEMDNLWLPIVKTWRLNERMYGELTGLSKMMVKQRHGETQFKAWRRGFDVRPPAVSSFSQNYPGNDPRYRYISDVRYSVKETAIRSIEKGKPMLVRKLPKTESLKDCMDRTIPYFVERIAKDAIDQNKRVLISSSENAIRGLLMHLCDIPESEITGLEIPNGLPLIYDIQSKCVKLLDDGTGRDPLEVYNFGTAAKYLFRPCQNEDGTEDEECTIQYDSVLTNNDEDQVTLDYIKSKMGR